MQQQIKNVLKYEYPYTIKFKFENSDTKEIFDVPTGFNNIIHATFTVTQDLCPKINKKLDINIRIFMFLDQFKLPTIKISWPLIHERIRDNYILLTEDDFNPIYPYSQLIMIICLIITEALNDPLNLNNDIIRLNNAINK